MWQERSFRIAGQPFGLRATCPAFLREFRHVLRPFPVRDGPAPGLQHYEVETLQGYLVRKGRRVLCQCATLDDAVEYLESELYGQLVRLLDRTLLFHAGGVARRDNLIVLPAGSGGGKTTLVAGLVKSGCLYLTDEMLILHPRTLRVRPLPKPLNMKYGSLMLFPRLGPELRRVRRGTLHDPRARIHHLLVRRRFRQRGWLDARHLALLFPVFRPGAAASLRTLERVEAVRRLAAASYNHYRFGARFLSLVERLTRGAVCAELAYGELQEALELIDRQVVPLQRGAGALV